MQQWHEDDYEDLYDQPIKKRTKLKLESENGGKKKTKQRKPNEKTYEKALEDLAQKQTGAS